MPNYTKLEILDRLILAMENMDTLYQQDFINYRGMDSAEKLKYTEIIAEHLIKNISSFKKIQMVTRQSSYRVVGHDGKLDKPVSNRVEEQLALNMYGNSYEHIGDIIDYQVPMKNSQKDKSVGKVDLLSFNGKDLIMLELKRKDNKETLLRCVLEAATYWYKINKQKLINDYQKTNLQGVKAAILVFKDSLQYAEASCENNSHILTLMQLLNIDMFVIEEYDSDLLKIKGISEMQFSAGRVAPNNAYSCTVKKHLGNYKRDILKITEDGIYHNKNRAYYYSHILPDKFANNNILERYRADFLSSEYEQNITRHKMFHHLNSSQAMCINFFYPLIQEKAMGIILRYLNIEGKLSYASTNFVFEKESTIEKTSGRKTSFDFFIKLDDGTEICFEIKYTESGFGKAKHDAAHKEKFLNIYLPLLINNKGINDEYKNETFFLDNYQIMRNLVHINDKRYVVVIYPEGNLTVHKEINSVKDNIMSQTGKENFRHIGWENLIDYLNKELQPGDLRNYYVHDFSDKYLNITMR